LRGGRQGTNIIQTFIQYKATRPSTYSAVGGREARNASDEHILIDIDLLGCEYTIYDDL
jgi:hypothetical protein